MTETPHVPLDAIARRALEFVSDGSVVGLGTGQAATAFIHELALRLRKGLRVRGIPTSQGSADLAIKLGIPLTTLEQVSAIDVDVDGADEVDPHGNLIKGYGGALVRERIVAAAARRFIVLVGDEKLVPRLGGHGKLPVEVVPFGLAPCLRSLSGLGFDGQVRLKSGQRVLTDNGNHIVDCRIPPLDDPEGVDATIRAIPGVVGTGLFLDMRPTVLIQHPDRIEFREDGRAN
jgi:ribose 5-phosphate isomerase A